jgi:GAF domain-containing protein
VGLRVAVDLMSGARLPMFLAWGAEARLVYNDACIALLGDRHPAAFGQPLAPPAPDAMADAGPHARDDAWSGLAPFVAAALAGEASLVEDLRFNVQQDGREVRRYLTLSASPVHEGDTVIGACCILTDTTARVLAEQQHRFHLKLAGALRELFDPLGIMEAASALLGRHLAVGRVGYGEIDPSGRHVSVERDWTDGTIASLAGETRPLDSFGPAIIARLRAGQVLRLDDIAADPLAAPHADAYASIGARAMVVVPIIEAGRLAAIFYLHEANPRDWTGREVALAEDVARQTSEAVRRARVEETLRDESRILEVLHRTGQALASTLDLDTLLQAITDAGTQLSGARYGAFLYHGQDERGERMQLYTLSRAKRSRTSAVRVRPPCSSRPSGNRGPCAATTSRSTRATAARAPTTACRKATCRCAATLRCRWCRVRERCWAAWCSGIRRRACSPNAPSASWPAWRRRRRWRWTTRTCTRAPRSRRASATRSCRANAPPASRPSACRA